MQVASVPIGGDGGSVSLGVSAGNVVVSAQYPVEKVLDSALVALEAKYPSLAPEIAILKAAVDAQLAQP